jgi:hypothetical protein
VFASIGDDATEQPWRTFDQQAMSALRPGNARHHTRERVTALDMLAKNIELRLYFVNILSRIFLAIIALVRHAWQTSDQVALPSSHGVFQDVRTFTA